MLIFQGISVPTIKMVLAMRDTYVYRYVNVNFLPLSRVINLTLKVAPILTTTMPKPLTMLTIGKLSPRR
jgi:hypothetical protein